MKKNDFRRIVSFTLIELLVVVGIIAILLCLLLPALQNAKMHAVLVSCKSQLRQINLGIVNYATDFRDRMIAPLYGREHAIGCQTGDTTTGVTAPTGLGVLYGNRYLTSDDLLLCPGHSDSWHPSRSPSYGATTQAISDTIKRDRRSVIKEYVEDGVSRTGRISSYAFNAASSTYVFHTPTTTFNVPLGSKPQVVKDVNDVDSYGRLWDWQDNQSGATEWHIASRYRNNMSGSFVWNISAGTKAYYSFPQVFVMCAIQCYWYYYDAPAASVRNDVHSRRAFNVLFADGTVYTKNCTGGSVLMIGQPRNPDDSNLNWYGKFRAAATAYPGYEEPRANWVPAGY